ncbi:hypothetical protein HPP92_000780 [Vanilla planifolia]|uniref:Zinc finger CCCH domain-containing protein 53 n=1 Tax=Vanilla planifolia TaxID=51239 RepID=A0A835VCY3_VANPL|nr:hypothetical protein HPP92_000780 [Vanilla planifolia]
MDAYEATKIVFSRIQSLDPENAAKIMGLLLMQDHGEEMIRLAFGPESLLRSVVLRARKELGVVPISAPHGPSLPPLAKTTLHLPRQNSASRLLARPPALAVSSPSSWAPPSPFSRTIDETQLGDEFIDELQLREQLSFLNDPVGPKTAATSAAEILYPEECRSPTGNELFAYRTGWSVTANGGAQRRSFSISDLYLEADQTGISWKPCLYFARGYCKNGSSCRFLHGLSDDLPGASAGKIDAVADQDLLLRSNSQRLMVSATSAFPHSPTSSLPAQLPSLNGKCMNFLIQQQQCESQRAAAAAATAAAATASLVLGAEDSYNRFMGRSRLERYDLSGMVNPGSRQIYLTFPADSTFREEDVSNYFNIYGPVQDVRIPYQQKRMFGFVTFVYPETVKLILAKGNPHFVCDARVLVKPYKEKGKIPEKYRKQQSDRMDFSGCGTPTVLDSSEIYDLKQLVSGARERYAGSNQDALLTWKLDDQQELKEAIELQQRRFIGLQLLNLKMNSPTAPSAAVPSPSPLRAAAAAATRAFAVLETEKSPRSASPAAAAAVALPDNEVTSTKDAIDFQESAEPDLPDSPFASAFTYGNSFSLTMEADSGPALATSSASSALHSSTLLPSTSTLDSMASFNSCFFQIPRFSGAGAVGL